MSVKILALALQRLADNRREALANEPPIPCLLREQNDTNGHDYDCDYEHAGSVDCDNCIVNGGALDPRTGKRYRKQKGSTT